MNEAPDALTWLHGHTRTWRGKSLFAFIFLLPALGNIISRLTKRGWWLNDYDALACGASKIGQGLSPYGLHPVCAGLRPAVFVYAPQIGQIFAPFVNAFGFAGSRWVYLLPLLAMMGVLLWYALIKVFPGSPRSFRLMSLAAMAGSAFACGNIGLILHGIVVLSALMLKRTRWPFVAAVILAACVKPVMLTYFVVLLYEDRRLIKRLALTTILAACAGVAAIAITVLSAGPWAAAWRATLDAVVIHQQPGIGFFAFTSLLGLDTTSPVTLAALGVFLAAMTLSGLIIAQWSGLNNDQRIVLGLGMAQLLNPRLMDYDMLMLAPCMAMIVMLAKPLGDKAFFRLSWLFAATLTACVIVNLAGVKFIHRAPYTIFVYILITLSVAALTARRHRTEIKAWLKNPGPALHSLLAQRPGA